MYEAGAGDAAAVSGFAGQGATFTAGVAGAVPEFADVVYRASIVCGAAADEVTLRCPGARDDGRSFVCSSAVQRRGRADPFAAIFVAASADLPRRTPSAPELTRPP